MKKAILTFAITIICCTAVLADVPAVAFYVLKKSDLSQLLEKEKVVAKLDVGQLEEKAVYQGHFEGPCKLYLKNKDYQFRINVKPIKDSARLSFALSMYSKKESKSYGCSGAIEPQKDITTVSDWNSPLSENLYVVLFKKVNLKK